MASNGLLVEVRWEWNGTELSADHLTGATVLNVVDPLAVAVDEEVWIGGSGPYTVTDTDEDNDTVTIEPGLLADFDLSTEVALDVGGQPGQVWVAEVVVPDTDEPIEIPLTIHDLSVMPEGIYNPPVSIVLSDDLDGVIDLPGSMPIVNGGFIPPDTLPPDAEAVQDYVVEYAVGGSETVAPTTGWSTDTPVRNPGEYIWMRTTVTRRDQSTSTTSPALLTGNDGADGADGAQGIPGPPGDDGQSLYTWLKYADTPTTGMADTPDGKTYIGLAYNKTSPTESSTYADYQWSLIKGADGADGADGAQGVPGPPGDDGQSLYTWVKYADTPTTGMADDPTGKTYIGLAYNKTSATESSTYADYQWALIKGADGEQGVPGPPGDDGQSLYTWIKYADDATGTGMADDPTGKEYIGLAYNKTTATESTTPGDYTWALIKGADGADGSQGVPGPPGDDGQSLYTWVKYADTPTTGMSDDPTGKEYIGLAYNKTSPTESSTYGDYTWALIKGADGSDGLQGPPGDDGQSLYTWLKYADTPTTGMSDDPTGKTYIGLAYNKTSPTESTTYGDYTWALIKGADGSDGADGVPGPPGDDGQSLYTWIKYADTAAGAGLTDDPTGKEYIGLAYNKTTATESTTPGDYTWALIQGAAGSDGADGADGVSVTSIRPYFAQVTAGAAAPALPTTDPPPAPWVSPEPAYVEGTDLYRTERILFSNSTFAYTEVMLDSTYSAANAAYNLAEGKSTVYRSPEPPWENNDPVPHPDDDLWWDTDFPGGTRPFIWDADNLLWVDASTPPNDLGDLSDAVVGDTTLAEIAEQAERAAETATRARNLASTADGRVSFSDFDPTTEDLTYYVTNIDGTLARDTSWDIVQRGLTNEIATLTVTDAGMTMQNGEFIVVEGIGAPFDGEWLVLSSVNTIVDVTNLALTSGTVTLTLASTSPWAVGQTVIVSGVDSAVNGEHVLTAVSGTSVSYVLGGTPDDIASTAVTEGTASTHEVTYGIPNEANVALANAPAAATGYNTLLLNRQPGSVWYTRTRARRNLLTNPSFEVDLTGWSGEAATLARVATPLEEEVVPGSAWVAQVTNSAAAGDHAIQWTGGTPGMVATPGATYAAAAQALLVSGDGDGAYASMQFFDASSVLIDEIEGQIVQLATEDWTEVTVSATAPPNAAYVAPAIFHNPNVSAVWMLDTALVEEAEYPGRYFDGNTTYAKWGEDGTGTPHASESHLDGGRIISVWELYDNGWVNLDFTGSTQYDADASDLTTGTLPPARIADNSIEQDKMMTSQVKCSDAVTAGDFVQIWDNNGLFQVRPADASLNRPAHGFVLADAAAGALVHVYSSGYNGSCAGLSPGVQFLSATDPGVATNVPPTGAGKIVQQLGTATAANVVHFIPQQPVLLY